MARPTIPLEIRFWNHVNKTEKCWAWVGDHLPRGYGRIRVAKRMKQAHRVSYELAYGVIPEGICVLHHCDNPPCVRPDHLFLGTNGDNNADRANKDRSKMFSIAEAAAIKCESEHTTVKALAAQRGVSISTIRRAIYRAMETEG